MKLISFVLATWIYPLLVFSHEEDYDWVNEMLYEFTGIGNDLTKVTWAHAVNSQAELKKALKGDAMFLEADVSIGEYTGDNPPKTRPIMAHPPNTTSDLTLEQFLDETLKTEKHVKLDFKSDLAFSSSESIVTDALLKHSYAKRIWLNADIIPGPINCTKGVVDADYFLSTCVAKFPEAVISAGWSTCYSQNNSKGKYTQEQIEMMTDALNKNMVISAVSFPVRAGLAAQSYLQLKNLMRTSLPETTLTIWSAPGDLVDVVGLRKLIDTVGKDRIFIDVPEDLQHQIIYGPVERLDERSTAAIVSSMASLTLASILLVLNIF